VTITRTRATALTTAFVAALAAALLLAPAGASAATIKACANKKTGAVRLISGKKKCKKTEKKISWNTKGVAGANGANGTNGTNGTNGANGLPGQPQKVVKFSASQGSTSSTNLVSLFQADGVTYSFNCGFAFIFNIARIVADGPSGTSYAQGALRRPSPATRQSADPWSDVIFATLGGGAKNVASQTTLADAGDGIEQIGTWTVTVEGPSATTFIYAKISAAATCTTQGVAFTIPNS
jgi:hypothetical protein